MHQLRSTNAPADGNAAQNVRPGLGLGSLFGVEIRADWSLLVIFALIAFNLGAGVFPSWHPDWSLALSWGVAFAAATLFFVSVLAHELSHALVGRAQGVAIRRITLFLFGGAAHLEGEPPSPKAEFWMAIVGPVTSLVIGVGATAAGMAMAGQGAWPSTAVEQPLEVFSVLAPVPTLLLWLGPINVVLAVFNVLPGFPLDGGRVLRSALWAVTGDFVKATAWAAAAGRALGWGLMALGVVQAFGGALLDGMWLVLIGWFLSNAARMSYQQVLAKQALENVSVADVMRTRIATVGPETTVQSLVHDVLLVSDQDCVPVVAPPDGLVGLVTLADARTVPMDDWSVTPVRQVMRTTAETGSLPPDAAAQSALDKLARSNGDQLPIVKEGRLLGLVSGRDLVRRLSLAG
jgi:Zn-dependent protease/CBS domain-containing protein